MTLSPPSSSPLVLRPDLLDRRTGSRNSPQPTLPSYLAWNSTGLFDFSQDFDRPTPAGAYPNPRDNESIWIPPTDAAPALSLEQFVEEAWPLLEPAVPFVSGWHLSLLCEHLEAVTRGELHDVLINVPPGTTKSLTVGVFWPAWEWSWRPWTRWLTSSYDDRLALRDAVRTRRLMQTIWYRNRVTVPWSFVSDQNVKGYYLNDRMGWRIATSVDGANTGEHAHRVVIDDPHNVRKAESDLERESVLMVWREVYPSRRLPGGARVVVGQRVHEEDVTADWLEREGDVIHHIDLPMEFDVETATERQAEPCSLTGYPHDPRHEDGALLAPERFPAERIERLKIDLGPYAYSAQYQQRPTPRAGMVLNPAWFIDRPADVDLTQCDVIQAWDLNYSEKDASDWTIGITAAVERNPTLPRMHILDVYAKHLAEERHDTELAAYMLVWRPRLVGIERRAFEKQGATRDLVRALQRQLQGKLAVTIDAVEADTDKLSRAMIIPGRAKAGLISVDRRAEWWTALSAEMSKFPKSAHDDRIDALAHLVRLAVERLERVRSLAAAMRNPAPLIVGTRPVEVNRVPPRVNVSGWPEMRDFG